jgi:hypothetical protein
VGVRREQEVGGSGSGSGSKGVGRGLDMARKGAEWGKVGEKEVGGQGV